MITPSAHSLGIVLRMRVNTVGGKALLFLNLFYDRWSCEYRADLPVVRFAFLYFEEKHFFIDWLEVKFEV